jgi:hypothetical protein
MTMLEIAGGILIAAAVLAGIGVLLGFIIGMLGIRF